MIANFYNTNAIIRRIDFTDHKSHFDNHQRILAYMHVANLTKSQNAVKNI